MIALKKGECLPRTALEARTSLSSSSSLASYRSLSSIDINLMSCGAHLPRILSLSAGPESCKHELKKELMLGGWLCSRSLLWRLCSRSLLAAPMFTVTTGSAYVHGHYWVPVVRLTLLGALKQVAGLALALALADGYLKRKVWISMEQDA